MLGGGKVKQIYELKGQGCSKRQIAKILGISRNTVTKYLNSPEIPKAKPRSDRSSKLDPFKGYLQERIAVGITNCVILMREVKSQGYTGGYTLLLEAGENPKIVSGRLGHASVTLTLDTYSHVLPDMQQRAAEKLESLIFGLPKHKEVANK
jgi:hypothetical protein